MAASTNNNTITSPIVVMGPLFCISEHPIQLLMAKRSFSISMGNFTLTDLENNIIFKLETSDFSFHDQRVLRDSAGNAIVTIRNKVPSWHETCKVFRGESKDENDLLFTAKSDSYEPFNGTLKNIFLANNTQQIIPDFILEGSEKTGIYNFYKGHGNSKLILAQMYKKKNFTLAINPNVDCAFIASLIAVLNVALRDDIAKLENVNKCVSVLGAIVDVMTKLA